MREGGGLADPLGGFAASYGMGAEVATLIRPDGVVAWRAPGAADGAADEIGAALGGMLRRSW